MRRLLRLALRLSELFAMAEIDTNLSTVSIRAWLFNNWSQNREATIRREGPSTRSRLWVSWMLRRCIQRRRSSHWRAGCCVSQMAVCTSMVMDPKADESPRGFHLVSCDLSREIHYFEMNLRWLWSYMWDRDIPPSVLHTLQIRPCGVFFSSLLYLALSSLVLLGRSHALRWESAQSWH